MNLILMGLMAGVLSTSHPIQVITSGPNEPLTYAPIEETDCKPLIHLPGKYEYHQCAKENGSSLPECHFNSMIEVLRVRGHDETFLVVEKTIPQIGGGGRLTPFHYLQLWNHSGCTLIYADEKMRPTWDGANIDINEAEDTIILTFHTGSVGFLKRIQVFPKS